MISLVAPADAISENNPRVIDDGKARKLAADLKRCSYYETCATYGLNVDRVFHDGKSYSFLIQMLSVNLKQVKLSFLYSFPLYPHKLGASF